MRYHVLGPLELMTSAGPLHIRGKRVRALLAVLLMYSGQVVSIDRIVDDIWLDDPPRSAVENVRTYIYQLRALLNSGSGRSVLESQPGGYRLLVDSDALDVTHFLRLAEEGRQAHQRGEHAAAAGLLGDALALWRGAPLSGLDLGRATRAKAIALEEQRWQVQADWISARLAVGETGELVAPLREFLGERPLDENLWCLLVTALVLAGRTGEALAAFDEARQILVQELGIEPGPELRRLHGRVLRGDALLVPSPSGSGMPAGGSAPHQLPSDVPQLVGRDDALQAIGALARRSLSGEVDHVPTVLVSGPPGIGKTAMAVVAAEKIHSWVPDGELYVNLRGLTDRPLHPTQAVTVMLRALGIDPADLPDGLDGRRSLYRELLSERRMLIVLDDAAGSQQVLPLIPGPCRSLVIVASRRRLTGVPADLRLALDPLSTPAALQMLGNAIGPERVAKEPAAAADIVEACGRLPCAIWLAGARLCTRPNHPVQLLADRLESQDRVLDEFSLDGSSLRERFAMSYQALDPQARRCFRALGLFPADAITADGIGLALGVPLRVADRELERLVQEGLLSTGLSADGLPIFGMPTVLHTYAGERLEAEGLLDPLVAEPESA